MEMFLDFATVPAITLISFWVVELIKQITNNNQTFKRFIPITATAIGVVLGLVIFFTLPNISIASNWLFACVVGGASGLAATGSNELIKQLKKNYNDPESEQNNIDTTKK